MLPNMDKWFVLDSILPFVANLPSKDAATLMTTLGNYYRERQLPVFDQAKRR